MDLSRQPTEASTSALDRPEARLDVHPAVDVSASPSPREEQGDTTREHFPPLDGLRGVALVLVVFHHAFHTTDPSWPGRVLQALASVGWVGVNLFFVLSGFLISGILLDARPTWRDYLHFYARRSLRIFPLYYAYIIVFLYVVPIVARRTFHVEWPSTQGGYVLFLYLKNYETLLPGLTFPEFMDPLWSLAVEEQIYLVWPALILLCPRARLPRVLGALAVVALAWRTFALMRHFNISASYSWTPACLDAFACGALVAFFLRGPEGQRLLERRAGQVSLASGMLLLGMFLSERQFTFWSNPVPILTIGLSALAVFFASLIACIVLDGRAFAFNSFLNQLWLRRTGRYSYAMYLFHTAAIGSLGPVFTWLHGGPTFHSRWWWALVFTLSAYALTYLAAFASWHLFEVHFLRLKAFFPMVSHPVPLALMSSTANVDDPEPAFGTGGNHPREPMDTTVDQG